MNQQPKNNSKILSYIAIAVILILLYLYITKPTQTTVMQTNSTTQNNSGYQSISQSNSQLQQQNQNLNSQLQQIQNNQRTPIITNIYSDMAITVPSTNESQSIQFYNYTYNLYNNYTTNGGYNLTFNVPYDGYIIVHILNSDAPPGTWSFGANSNASSYEYYTSYYITPIVINTNGVPPLKPTAGFSVVPDRNTSFSQIIPVLRGLVKFNFQNTNNYPISVQFSITYVGENYTNLIPLTVNYSTN